MTGMADDSWRDQTPLAAPRRRSIGGTLLIVVGGGLVLLMSLMLAFQALLVAWLVPDVPADPDRGGLPVCSTWECIDEARTVYLALALAIVALVVVVVTWLRGGWSTIGGCLALMVGVGLPAIDPDLEPLMRGVAIGLLLAAAGAWVRLRVPIPPSWRGAAATGARRFWDQQVVPTFRDAFDRPAPATPPDRTDPDPDAGRSTP